MFPPDIVTLDMLIILGRIYDWIVSRKLPIAVFGFIALFIVTFNVGYVAFKCARKCSSTDCAVYPATNTTLKYQNDGLLCCEFSKGQLVQICSRVVPPALFSRGYVYKLDAIYSIRNASLHLAPIVLYPLDVPVNMPTDCLNYCISQSESIMLHLSHVRRQYIANYTN